MMRPGPFVVSSPGFGVLVVAIGTLVVPFDSSVNFAFPYITRAFGLPITSIQWVIISYTLTYAALMLVFGRVGDMLGYRRVFLIGSAWSAVAFVCCGLAPTYGALLAARILQGVGAALVLSCGPALATGLYTEHARTRVLATYTMVIGIGSAFGPPLAGLLVQQWGWPAVFWFRVPFASLAFILGWALPADTRSATRQSFDAVGGALLVLAISAMLLTLNRLQHLDENVLWLLLPAATAVMAAIGFVLQEQRVARPIIDLRFFRHLDFSLLNLAHVALNLAGFAVLLLVPFYLARFGGLPAQAIGLLLAASPAGTMVAAPLAGRLAGWLPPRRLAVIGAGAMTMGQLLIAMTGTAPNIPLLATAMVMQGFGIGLFQVAYFDIVTSAIPRADRGVAGSLVMMTRTIGVVTGATMLTLIFQILRDGALFHGVGDSAAFLDGFTGTFQLTALLPAAVVVIGLARGWLSATREPN
jgi:EmrB/QacA subfamily drug resistance transporter